MNTEKNLLSTNEAGEKLDESKQHIVKLISIGELKGHKLDNGRWAVELESAQQFLVRKKSKRTLLESYIKELMESSLYKFKDWKNNELPNISAGVYLISKDK